MPDFPPNQNECETMEAWIYRSHQDNKRLGLVEINAWIAQFNDDELPACRLMKKARAKIIELDEALRAAKDK